MSKFSLKDLYVAAIKGNPYHAKDGKFTTASGVGQADEIPSPPKRQDIPATILSRQYIHGTSKSDGMKILESGEIRPRDADPKKRGGMMDPVKNRIYLSSSPDYNAIYALGGDVAGTNYFEDEYGKKDIERNGRYGYLFEVDNSALVDIQPDEDQVGEATYKAFRGDDFRGQPVIPVILHLAQKHLTPNQIRKVKDGDYASWAAAGKKIVKHMTDGQKISFIELYNSHVAHDGALPIKRAWRVDRTRGKEIKRDGSNLFEIAEEIPVKDSLRKSVSRAIKAFDPNQPRDERGRWSSGGKKFNEAAERTMLEVLGEASNWQTASWIGESGKYIGEGVDHEESAQRVVDKLGLPEKGLGAARQLVALGAIRLSGSDNDWAISIGAPPTDKQWAALRSVIEGANYLTWDLSGAGQERVWSTSRASADERESDLRDSVGAYFRQNDVAGVVSDPALAAEWMADGVEARFGWNEKNTRAGYLARKKRELRANPASKEFTSRVDEATKKLRASGVVGKDVMVVALGKGESGYESGRYDDTTKTIYLYEDSKPGSRETLGEPVSSVSSAFENPIEGTLAHEYGHHVASVIDPGSLDRANFILAESSREVRGQIKRLISYYASTHPVEFVAETYALRNHPKYDDLGDDTKSLVGRILGETMTKAGFDPSEPRDERGRWTTGGVQTSWEGEFEKFAGGDATAVNSARHFVETQIGGEGKYDTVGAEQKKSRFEIKYVGKLGPGISKGKREESFGDESTGIFTSSFDVYTNDALGKDFSDTVPESFLALAGPNTFFRGMDDKGLLDAMKRGQIESLGGLNIGDSQIGRTYFSLSPQTAINYTTSLTGPKWRPTFERSCYVVAVRGVPGQDGWDRDEAVDEWGKRGPTSVDDIVGVLEIRVRSQEPGSIDLNDRGRMSSAWPPHTKYAYRDATQEFVSRGSVGVARPSDVGSSLAGAGTPSEMRSSDDEWRRATEKTARLLVDNTLNILRPGDVPKSIVDYARAKGSASILEETPVRERVKQKGSEWLATRIVGEVPSAKNGGTDIVNKISDLFGSWAETTNKSPEAFVIQQAAELEFGSRLSSWQKDIQSGNATSSGLLGGVSLDDARKILRAMYNETQLGLRFAGYKSGDKLTLFRGMAVASDTVDAPGAVVGYQGNALESWTTDLHTARTFSVTQADDAAWNMVVLAMDVPVEHVLSLASSGLGCLPEQEVVIMGGLGEGKARVAFSQPGIRWAVLEDLPPGPDEEEAKKGETMPVIINNQPDWMKQLPHSGSEKRIARGARKASGVSKSFNSAQPRDWRGRWTRLGSIPGLIEWVSGKYAENEEYGGHRSGWAKQKTDEALAEMDAYVKRNLRDTVIDEVTYPDTFDKIVILTFRHRPTPSVEERSEPDEWSGKPKRVWVDKNVEKDPRYGTDLPESMRALAGKPDVAFRGISDDEMRNILRTGRIHSDSSMNFTDQQRHTLMADSPDSARSYATGFAIPGDRPRFGKPGYILAVDLSGANYRREERVSEIDVADEIPAGRIIGAVEAALLASEQGRTSFRLDGTTFSTDNIPAEYRYRDVTQELLAKIQKRNRDAISDKHRRAVKASLKKFNPNHDEKGRFASSSRQGGNIPLGKNAISGVIFGGENGVTDPRTTTPFKRFVPRIHDELEREEAQRMGRDIYLPALKVIESVLGLDDLETHWRGIDFYVNPNIGEGTLACVTHDEYWDSKKDANVSWPYSLSVNPTVAKSAEAKMVLAHEYGHVVDALLRPDPRARIDDMSVISSEGYTPDPLLGKIPESKEGIALMRAIGASETVSGYKKLVDGLGQDPPDGNGYRPSVLIFKGEAGEFASEFNIAASHEGKNYLWPDKRGLNAGDFKANVKNYYMAPNELFARAFSQYVAVKSGDPEMLAEVLKHAGQIKEINSATYAEFANRGMHEFELSRIEREAHPEKPRYVRYSTHLTWPLDDFAPIEAAFDALFRAKGMIK